MFKPGKEFLTAAGLLLLASASQAAPPSKQVCFDSVFRPVLSHRSLFRQNRWRRATCNRRKRVGQKAGRACSLIKEATCSFLLHRENILERQVL